MKKKVLILLLVVAMFFLGSAAVFAADTAPADAGNSSSWKWIASALAVGLSCIGGGIAIGQIGAAAMGAMSENPELSGKALPFIGLAEGVCLWGFLIGLLILFM